MAADDPSRDQPAVSDGIIKEGMLEKLGAGKWELMQKRYFVIKQVNGLAFVEWHKSREAYRSAEAPLGKVEDLKRCSIQKQNDLRELVFGTVYKKNKNYRLRAKTEAECEEWYRAFLRAGCRGRPPPPSPKKHKDTNYYPATTLEYIPPPATQGKTLEQVKNKGRGSDFLSATVGN